MKQHVKQMRTLIDALNKHFDITENIHIKGVKVFFSGSIHAYDKKVQKVVPFRRIRAVRRTGDGLSEDAFIREVLRNYTDDWKAEDWQSFEELCKENL